MLRWQTLAGLALGVTIGILLLELAGNRTNGRPHSTGPILSECDGQIRELVVHYEPVAKEVVATPYREFLSALETQTIVHVVCPTAGAFDDLCRVAGPAACRLRPLVVSHPMTTWSRDRWVALGPTARGGPVTLWTPRAEAAEEIWPARAGDERIGQDLAAALAPSVATRRSDLYFDGGDLLADKESVFVASRVLARNLQHTVHSRHELLQVLFAALKRRVILLDPSPDHHVAMFMASVGRRTVFVGDPSLGNILCASADGHGAPALLADLPGGADFTPETQRMFDAVAAQCSSAGYRVVRMPVLLARDGRTYLTYTNVIIDQPGHRRIVYLPYYRGVEALNAAARARWENEGYEVHSVDCTSTFRHFGCLHCLVNVLKRG